MFRTRLLAVLCIIGFTTAASAAETLDDVKKKIHDKLASYKTLQFKSQTKSDISAEHISMKSDTNSFIQCMKQGDKVLTRTENTTKGENKFGKETQPIDANTLSICDGEYIYMYNDGMGQKAATKQKADKTNMWNPFDMLAAFKIQETVQKLRLLPDETVNGKPCWAIETTMKNPQPGTGAYRSVLYYDKGTGISLKSLTYDEKGKVTTTSTTSDIKIDESIPRERFIFEPPQGVEVQDLNAAIKKGG